MYGVGANKCKNLNLWLTFPANFPPKITGDQVVTIIAGEKYPYIFTVTDSETFTIAIAGTQPDHVGSLSQRAVISSDSDATVRTQFQYVFGWISGDATNFSITIVATDKYNAASILEIKVSLIYLIYIGVYIYMSFI